VCRGSRRRPSAASRQPRASSRSSHGCGGACDERPRWVRRTWRHGPRPRWVSCWRVCPCKQKVVMFPHRIASPAIIGPCVIGVCRGCPNGYESREVRETQHVPHSTHQLQPDQQQAHLIQGRHPPQQGNQLSAPAAVKRSSRQAAPRRAPPRSLHLRRRGASQRPQRGADGRGVARRESRQRSGCCAAPGCPHGIPPLQARKLVGPTPSRFLSRNPARRPGQRPMHACPALRRSGEIRGRHGWRCRC
jgi:hypothetical protein